MTEPYSKLYAQAMRRWNDYGDEYRTLVPTYLELLKQKREENIKPLRKLCKTDLEEYPSIEFLELEDEAEAEDYLLELRENKLANLIYEIDKFVDSRIRRILQGRICDYKQQIRLSKCDATPLAMDPDYGAKHASKRRFNRRSRVDAE